MTRTMAWLFAACLLSTLSPSLPISTVTAQQTANDSSASGSDVDLQSLSFDAMLTDYQYALKPEMFSLNSQNKSLQMAYVFLQGEADKPVVTLLHGKNFNADYWTPVANDLNQQGYSVLIPDQIGFGKSSKPVDYQYSFPGLANNTYQLMQELGIKKSIVVGHSMGGIDLSELCNERITPDSYQSRLGKPIGGAEGLHCTNYTASGLIVQMGIWRPQLNLFTPRGLSR